jgi:hypothetical protein
MNTIRKISILSLLLLLGLPLFAYGIEITNPLVGVNDIPALLNKIADIVAGVVGTVAVIMFLIAGILFLTSAGDPGRLQTAKTCFWYAIIGVAVALGAKALIAIVTTAIGVPATH